MKHINGGFICFIFILSAACSQKQIFTVERYRPILGEDCRVNASVGFSCKLARTVTFISSGQSCKFEKGGLTTEYRCENGKLVQEKYGGISIHGKRHRRNIIKSFGIAGATIGSFFGPAGTAIGGAIGTFIGGIACIFVCNKKEQRPPNKPPSIDCNSFNISNTYEAPVNQTTLVIRYERLTAHDPEDGIVSVSATPSSPAKLQRGTNVIYFTARDKQGHQASCVRSVELKVDTCRPPPRLNNGYVQCQNGEIILGNTCHFSCNDGYNLHGDSTLTCEGKNLYDEQYPKCSVVQCKLGDLKKPANGFIVCDTTASEYLPYRTFCYSQCDKGYGTTATVFSKCEMDGSWSQQLSLCKDIQPPQINCHSSIVSIEAEKGLRKANVTWKIPTAVDNSGPIPANMIIQKEGPKRGTMFEGSAIVSYFAKDPSNNESPTCTFLLDVRVGFCDPPYFDGDSYIRYRCKDRYQYGSTCSLSCAGSYPLVGNSSMTCEKNVTSGEFYWDWGSEEMPYCKQNKCPALPPPINGALSCDKWMFGTQCAMQCNDKYDIPLGIGGSSVFTGLFICSTVVGKWTPLEYVPGCTARRVGKNHRIPGELVYSGDCNDETTKKQIKQNFINLMQKLQMDPGYKGVCPNNKDCSITNVQVVCGSTRGKRRIGRSTNDEITLTFEFVIKYEEFGNSTMEALNRAREKFTVLQNITKRIIDQGLMDVPNAKLDKSSLQFGEVDIDCGPGRFPKYSTITCAACAIGSYLEPTSGKCEKCSIGTYKDDEDALNCTSCPIGTSTETEGAGNVTECKDICRAGFFSSTGVEPCLPCGLGSYTSSDMATGCIRCEEYTFTEVVGKSSSHDCKNFDLSIDNADQIINLHLNNTLNTLSLAMWFRRTSEKSRLKLRIGGSNGITLDVGSTVNIIYLSRNLSAQIVNEEDIWVHIGVVVDSTGYIRMYKGGIEVFNRDGEEKPMLFPTAHFNSTVGMHISGLLISEEPLSAKEMQQISGSCIPRKQNSLLKASDLLKSNAKTFKIIIPSLCDAVDECLANPCNGHSCQNNLDGYTCICSGGYSGLSCEISPDFCLESNCENGATCQNGISNYTCICPARFKGTLCEIVPVDGGWSNWTDWFPCSESCGGGTRTRFRTCTNPAPGPDGNHCAGPSIQTETCNTFDCPSCPSKPGAYGVRLRCRRSGDTTKCNARCRRGLTFTPGHTPLDEYMCGKRTNYTWNGQPPSCSKIYSPRSITTNSAVMYPNFPCDMMDNAQTEIYNNAKATLPCVTNDTCNIRVEIRGCEQPRKKRSTDAEAIISLTSSLSDGDNLDLEEFMNNKTVSPGLRKLLTSVAFLEMSAQEINKTATVFKLSSVKVDFENIKVQTTSEVRCNPGQIRAEAACVDCPAGTFFNSNHQCEDCNFGSYQDQTGKTSCKLCPDGYSTDLVAASDIKFCIVTKLIKAEGATDTSESNTLTITVCLIGVVAVVIGTIVAVVIIRKRKRWRRFGKQDKEGSVTFKVLTNKGKLEESLLRDETNKLINS